MGMGRLSGGARSWDQRGFNGVRERNSRQIWGMGQAGSRAGYYRLGYFFFLFSFLQKFGWKILDQKLVSFLAFDYGGRRKEKDRHDSNPTIRNQHLLCTLIETTRATRVLRIIGKRKMERQRGTSECIIWHDDEKWCSRLRKRVRDF